MKRLSARNGSRHAALVAGMALLWAGRPVVAGDPNERAEYFEKEVRPVLADRCMGCHGPEKQKAGLRLDSLAAMLQGGDSGPALKPGDPEESLIIRAIRYDDDPQMPPKGRLRASEITALTEWVKSGALWPEVAPGVRSKPVPVASEPKVTAEDRAFWSFQPVREPAVPAVSDASWPKSDVDRFILARLEEAGLKPVRAADRRVLIRRATFDLIGLPPTPEEVEAFLADDSPEAFVKVVDRLLASPHYGERWGRHWLDVARYGEDQAHTFQARKYPYGYRYRDWVIRAFNEDMPYDQFIIHQIAGDLVEGSNEKDRLAALGYFALGPVYYGKAVFDELDDRVDTLCRGFLGLTVACARCHDHKFDPIPTEDYYALAGIFSSTEYREYPDAPAAQMEAYEKGQAAIQAKTDEIAEFLKVETTRLVEGQASEVARYMVAAWVVQNHRKTSSSASAADVANEEKLDGATLERWVKYLFDSGVKDKDRPYLARWRQVISAQDPHTDLSGVEKARTEVRQAAEAFESYVKATLALRDALDAHRKAAKANGTAPDAASAPSLSAAETKLVREMVAADGLFGIPKNQVEKRLPEPVRVALKAKRAELDRLKKDAPAKPPVIHSLTEGKTIANMRVHIRGNPENLGPEAPRHFLAVLSPDHPAAFHEGSGRLELARAIASKGNPLTARVMVNRIWEHHFGNGLVATPSNFGNLGERPSHPELLDYLASRFVASGWSIKAMHRLIVLSATYQLDSAFDQRGFEVDPDNRLLWRANRRRLEVEAWRDAMLAVSGQLDRALGGPSQELTSSDNRRRTVYAAISRHDLNNLLRLFDFPDPNITSDKRTVTSVPLQQLFVLNSEFIVSQARALASRLTGDADQTDEARIKQAYPLLFGREASDDEVKWGLQFLASEPGPTEAKPDSAAQEPLTPWQQYAQVLLGSNEFLFID